MIIDILNYAFGKHFGSFCSRSQFANVKISSRSHGKWTSDLDSPWKVMPKYKILGVRSYDTVFPSI